MNVAIFFLCGYGGALRLWFSRLLTIDLSINKITVVARYYLRPLIEYCCIVCGLKLSIVALFYAAEMKPAPGSSNPKLQLRLWAVIVTAASACVAIVILVTIMAVRWRKRRPMDLQSQELGPRQQSNPRGNQTKQSSQFMTSQELVCGKVSPDKSPGSVARTSLFGTAGREDTQAATDPVAAALISSVAAATVITSNSVVKTYSTNTTQPQ